jgi:hypothetical protein
MEKINTGGRVKKLLVICPLTAVDTLLGMI